MSFTISEQKVLNSEDEYEKRSECAAQGACAAESLCPSDCAADCADFHDGDGCDCHADGRASLLLQHRPVVGGGSAAPAGDAVRLYRLRHRRARSPACGRQRGVQPAPGRRQGAQGARRADGRGGAAVRPVHALHRRRAHDEALQHAGRAADHRYFHRVAVSADPDCGLCDYV